MIKITKFILAPAAFILMVNPGFSNTASLDEAVNAAKAELSSQIDIPESEIKLVQARATNWPDSSLGCPQKGMQYLPVVTPGYIVEVAVAEQSYTVHVGDGPAAICVLASVIRKTERPVRKQQVLNLLQLAREDLESRDGSSEQPIRLMAMKLTSWPDSSLGCPDSDKVYPQVETPGYLIELEQGEKIFRYHTDMSRVVLCEKT